MTEYVAPALAVYYATPAPLIEFATPSPVIECSALAPSVTCFTPSPQSLLAYTMAAVTADTTRSVNSQIPITDVGALLPHRSLVQRTLTPRPPDVRNGICVEPPRLLVNPGHLGRQGKQYFLVMPSLLGLVTFALGQQRSKSTLRENVSTVSSAERFEIWPRLC